MAAMSQSRMDTLVTTGWLSRHLVAPDLVVRDCSVHTEFYDGAVWLIDTLQEAC